MPLLPEPGEFPAGTPVSITIELQGTIHGYGYSIRPNEGRFVCIESRGQRRMVQLAQIREVLPLPSDEPRILTGDAGS